MELLNPRVEVFKCGKLWEYEPERVQIQTGLVKAYFSDDTMFVTHTSNCIIWEGEKKWKEKAHKTTSLNAR